MTADIAAPWRSMLTSASTRVVGLGVSSICTLFTARLIIGTRGTETYVTYGLIVSLAALIPFADLGVGALVTNAIAQSDTDSDPHILRVLVSTWRVLFVSATTLAGITVALGLVHAWPTILGVNPSGLDATATLCLMLFAISIPLGVGSRVLLGKQRNHIQIAFQALQGPLVLAAVAALSSSALPDPTLTIGFFLAVTITSALSLVYASRIMSPTLRMSFTAALGRNPEMTSIKEVLGHAAPMMVIMISLSIALQSDRIMLSHLGHPTDLAEYSLAAQLFLPIWAVISAAGVTLWPIFRRRVAFGVDVPFSTLARLALALSSGALALGGILISASGFVADWVSAGSINISFALSISFVGLLFSQAAQYPFGMYLTDRRGLGFQAKCCATMLPANLLLSLLLIPSLGPVGPVLASTLCMCLFQLVPYAIYAYMRTREVDHAW